MSCAPHLHLFRACVETSLGAHPSIGRPNAEVLEVAIALGELPLQEIFLENTPAALTEIAKETARSDRRLKGAIDQFHPALDMFGLDGKCSGATLEATARAVVASTRISQEHRSAIYLNQNVDESAFNALFKRWNGLLAKDAGWRRDFGAYGNAVWPTASALRSASELLSKGKSWPCTGRHKRRSEAGAQPRRSFGPGEFQRSCESVGRLGPSCGRA